MQKVSAGVEVAVEAFQRALAILMEGLGEFDV
jgi:hypothetical protein